MNCAWCRRFEAKNEDVDSGLRYCDACWYDIDVNLNLDVIETLRTDLDDARNEIERLKAEANFWRLRAMTDEQRKHVEEHMAIFEGPGR